MNKNIIITIVIVLFNSTIIAMEKNIPLDESQLKKQSILELFDINPMIQILNDNKAFISNNETFLNNQEISNPKKFIGNIILKGKQWWYLDEYFSHKKAVTAICFNHNDQLLATGSKDKRARIFNITQKFDPSQKEEHRLQHTGTINALCFDKTGAFLATGTNDSKTYVFNTDYLDQPFIIKHNAQVTSLSFNPTGTLLAIGFNNDQACTFSKVTKQIKVYPSTDTVKSVNFNQGKLLAIAAQNNVQIIDMIEGRKKNFSMNANFCIFDPTGKYLAIASPLFKAQIFSVERTKEVASIEHSFSVSTVLFNYTGDYLITRATDNIIRIFNIYTKQKVAHFTPEHTILSLCVGQSKNLVAIGTNGDNKAYIFALYKNWTLEQILLKKILRTWLLIERPYANINSSEKLRADIAIKFQLDEQELIGIWQSFPETMQSALWRSMHEKIKMYGKKETNNCVVT